jgi:uncharacterized membrane protein
MRICTSICDRDWRHKRHGVGDGFRNVMVGGILCLIIIRIIMMIRIIIIIIIIILIIIIRRTRKAPLPLYEEFGTCSETAVLLPSMGCHSIVTTPA